MAHHSAVLQPHCERHLLFCYYPIVKHYHRDPKISVVEQYTTVDKYLISGHFDPKVLSIAYNVDF